MSDENSCLIDVQVGGGQGGDRGVREKGGMQGFICVTGCLVTYPETL